MSSIITHRRRRRRCTLSTKPYPSSQTDILQLSKKTNVTTRLFHIIVLVYTTTLALSITAFVLPTNHPLIRYSNTITVTKTVSRRTDSSQLLPTHRRSIHHAQPNGDEYEEEEEEEEVDWRAFRARLVRDGLPSAPDTNILNTDNDTDTTTTTTTSSSSTSSSSSSSSETYAHESYQLIEVGTILLSVPTTDLCQALEQQFWHRSVVLITHVANDRTRGDEETSVPTEQLSQGTGRGRWGYRGLILNRITDSVLLDADTIGRRVNLQTLDTQPTNGDHTAEGCGGFRLLRGGDLATFDFSHPNNNDDDDDDGHHTEFSCLHSLTDPYIRNKSKRIVGNLFLIPFDDARALCCHGEQPKCRPSDFVTFGGFCSWRPGQLEIEMGGERGEWITLSVDGTSIRNELGRIIDAAAAVGDGTTMGDVRTRTNGGGFGGNVSGHRLLNAGTTMWRSFLNRIGRTDSDATDRIPAGQLDFYDRMLKVWAEENLSVVHRYTDGSDDDDDKHYDLIDRVFRPGTLVRATSPVSNDMLLFEQELIRAVVLILEDDEERTMGVVLNHPLCAAVEYLEDAPPLPLRYGGPIDEDEDDVVYVDADLIDFDFDNIVDNGEVYDGGYYDGPGQEDDVLYDDDDMESTFVWLHRDSNLGYTKDGGVPLGNSGLWRIGETQVLNALQSKTLRKEDVMVFTGVCIWEKGTEMGRRLGGLAEQIEVLKTMEVVRNSGDFEDDWEEEGEEDQGKRDVITRVWDILSRRQDVLGKDTFESNLRVAINAWHTCKTNGRLDDMTTMKGVISKEALADAALKGWIGVNLLGDPMGTLVEVKEKLIE